MSDTSETSGRTSIADRLAGSVSARGASLAFGDPIERDEVTILPVAMVTYGFGGGGLDDEKGGGGGGGAAMPLGIYVSDRDGTRFRPNLIPLLGVLVPVLWAGGNAIARIVKASRR